MRVHPPGWKMWGRNPGRTTRTTLSGPLFKNMALKGGRSLLSLCLDGLANSVGNVGITISIRKYWSLSGHFNKSGFYILRIWLTAVSGLKWQDCSQAELTTLLKIIGIQRWKRKFRLSPQHSKVPFSSIIDLVVNSKKSLLSHSSNSYLERAETELIQQLYESKEVLKDIE